jgi:hypothetical protein
LIPSGLALLAAVAGIVATASEGCRERVFSPSPDGGPDGASSDAPSPLTLDIAVTGCEMYEGDTARCIGSAPLALSFAPVGSPEFTSFRWSFGDGSPTVLDRAPVHTYTLPGNYDVRLVGVGEIGSIEGNRPTHVVVNAIPAGNPCDVDAQCAGGLHCTCTPGTGCPPAFIHGICTATCDDRVCAPEAICASVALADPTPRIASCLRDCRSGCAAGFVCQTLPAGGSGPPSWVGACLPLGLMADLGAPCRNADGALDDASCTSGSCGDLGALGVCTSACAADRPCPGQSICARLDDGRRLCLTECGPQNACVRDPLLACSAPQTGDAGSAGFQADGAPAGATYCAPKTCTSDADCAPVGRCGPSAQCVRLK